MIEATPRGFEAPDLPPSSAYDQCVRCGLCLPTCPTYLETLTETSSPRGRISLIKSVAEGHLDLLSPGFVHQMSECLDCQACEAVCPSGVHYGALIENARAQVERAQAPTRSPAQRFFRSALLLGLFAHLDRMRALASIVRFAQRTGLETLARRLGIVRLLGLEAAAAMAPRISDTFFVPSDQRYETKNAKAIAFLHVGCVMQVAFARVHEASVRVLQRAGCTVVVPADQGCCGAIAVHAGERDFSRELARRNISAFERSGADVYVVNAAGCGSALKEYDELLAEDPRWAQRAKRFVSRVRDITEVLDGLELDTNIGRLDVSVTYQEPCHLAHAQRVTGAPRRLLWECRYLQPHAARNGRSSRAPQDRALARDRREHRRDGQSRLRAAARSGPANRGARRESSTHRRDPRRRLQRGRLDRSDDAIAVVTRGIEGSIYRENPHEARDIEQTRNRAFGNDQAHASELF